MLSQVRDYSDSRFRGDGSDAFCGERGEEPRIDIIRWCLLHARPGLQYFDVARSVACCSVRTHVLLSVGLHFAMLAYMWVRGAGFRV